MRIGLVGFCLILAGCSSFIAPVPSPSSFAGFGPFQAVQPFSLTPVGQPAPAGWEPWILSRFLAKTRYQIVDEDGQRVRLTDPPITRERAEQLLEWMVRTVYLPSVAQLCPGADEPGRVAALIDFAFNLGAGQLRASTLRRKVNVGDWEAVPTELRGMFAIAIWDRTERELFLRSLAGVQPRGNVTDQLVRVMHEVSYAAGETLFLATPNPGDLYDVTISGSLKPDAAQSSNIGYELVVTGEGGIHTEVSGEFTYAVHQARVRRGSTHWTEQHNQIEHRLPRDLRGSELTITTDRVEDTLQNGLHVTVHPQSYDPTWFFVAGIFVVFAMIYVETRIGDSKTKPHLIMASATTLVFSYWYHLHATSNRMVAPTLDALLLAVITGGIGGTIVGAILRRASGRDRLKPALDDEKSEKASEPA